MRADLRRAVLAMLVMTVALGALYPLAVTGAGQVLFKRQADGDPRLIAHAVEGRGRFHPRPSQSDFSATATFFSNAGPNDAATRDAILAHATAYARREGIAVGDVPNDAAQTSASGIDPDISPANARIQARRVARERGLPVARILALVREHTAGPLLGIVGEPAVNVNDLNAALEAIAR